VHKGRAEAAEAEKMAAAVPSLGATPLDLDVRPKRAAVDSLSPGLQSLLSRRECCDIVFHLEKEEIEAHAVVLAATSPNFCKYLRQNNVCGLSRETADPGPCDMEELFTVFSARPVAEVPPAEQEPGQAEGTVPVESKESGETTGTSVERKQEAGTDPVSVESEAKSAEVATPPGEAKLRIQVQGLSSPAMHILLDYVYKGSGSATWEYQAANAQVNKEVLRLARYFNYNQLHEHSARWLAKDLNTANVVDRLVTCEEFGLGLLREKITERLALKPAELMLVCSSPEITKHPRILQDLLVQVASLQGNSLSKSSAETMQIEEDKEEETTQQDKAERNMKDKPDKHEKSEKIEKAERHEKKALEKAEKHEKPGKQDKGPAAKKRKAGA